MHACMHTYIHTYTQIHRHTVHTEYGHTRYIGILYIHNTFTLKKNRKQKSKNVHIYTCNDIHILKTWAPYTYTYTYI